MEAYSSPPESSGAAVGRSEVEAHDDGEGDNENAASAEDEAYAALEEARAQNTELRDLNNEPLSQVSTLEGEFTALADKPKKETERVNDVWYMSSEQVSAFDEAVTAKDAEISNLKARVAELEAACLGPAAPPTHTPASEFPRTLTRGLSVCASPLTSLKS